MEADKRSVHKIHMTISDFSSRYSNLYIILAVWLLYVAFPYISQDHQGEAQGEEATEPQSSLLGTVVHSISS